MLVRSQHLDIYFCINYRNIDSFINIEFLQFGMNIYFLDRDILFVYFIGVFVVFITSTIDILIFLYHLNFSSSAGTSLFLSERYNLVASLVLLLDAINFCWHSKHSSKPYFVLECLQTFLSTYELQCKHVLIFSL